MHTSRIAAPRARAGRDTSNGRQWRATAQRSSKQALALLLAQLLLLPLPLRAQEESAEVTGAFTVNDFVPSLASNAVSTTAATGERHFSVPVSARGSFGHSLPIEVPAGRNGMSPALALGYESGQLSDSVVGAGWQLTTAQVTRSTREGTPQLVREGTALRYADDDGAGARFSVGDAELVPLAAAATRPSTLLRQSTMYLAERSGAAPTVWEYSPLDDAWAEHRPSGVKAYYGADPFDTNGTTRVRNELGTFAWLLVREIDVDGSSVIYRYHFASDQTRANLRDAQRAPVLAKVSWGGNRVMGINDPFSVEVSISAGVNQGGVDYRRGNVRTAGRVSAISVCGPQQTMTTASGSITVGSLAASGTPCAGRVQYRKYGLAYTRSADTARWLLSSVTETVSDVAEARTTSFSYSSNKGHLAFAAPQVLPGATSGALRFLDTRLVMTQRSTARTPDEAMAKTDVTEAARFIDVTGDGRADLVHHAAGMGAVDAPVVSYADPVVYASEDPIAFEPFGVDVVRSAYKNAAGSFRALTGGTSASVREHLLAGSAPTGLVSSPTRYTDLADVDGDGRVDGVFFSSIRTDRPPPSRGACFSEDFWRACGPIDPPMPGFDVCAVSSVCEIVSELDLVACVDDSCWITEDLFVRLFDELADWQATPPTSVEGQQILAGFGISVEMLRRLVLVNALELRARIGLRVDYSESEAKDLELQAANAQGSSAEKCAGLLEWCHGSGGLDGLPAPHVDIDYEGLLSELCFEFHDDEICATPPHDHPTVHAPVMNLGVHVGGGTPLSGAALVPLRGWPAGFGKATMLTGPNGAGLPPYVAEIVADITAPIVDANGDGRADVLLLRGIEMTIANGMRPSFTFVPRAFIAHDAPSERTASPVGFTLDWDSFHQKYPLPGEEQLPVSDFTQSMSDILVTPGLDYRFGPEPSVFEEGVAFNSFVLDVNADGLPDLIAAEPAPTNLHSGHQVFLNRGYRFGVPAAGRPGATTSFVPMSAGAAQGPFGRLLKRELDEHFAAGRDGHVPMAGMSFVDVNADGRVDVVVWAGPSDQDGRLEIWLNLGDRFERAHDNGPQGTLAPLQVDLPAGVGTGGLRFANLEPSSLSNTRRGFTIGDLLRMEDVDDDGLVDLVVPGLVCPTSLMPETQCDVSAHIYDRADLTRETNGWITLSNPSRKLRRARFLRNLGERPDLLTGISSTGGAGMAIAYGNARTSAVVASDFVPPGLPVVEEVESWSAPGVDASLVLLSYADFVRGRPGVESTGFGEVAATFIESFEGLATTRATLTRRYHSESEALGVAMPFRGLVQEEIVDADGERTRTITTRSAHAVSTSRPALRVDQDAVIEEACTLAGASCASTPVARAHLVDARDQLGLPLRERDGDYRSGSLSDVVSTETAYGHRTGPWVLGLAEEQVVTGTRYDVEGNASTGVLSRQLATYDSVGRVLRQERPGVSDAACGLGELDELTEVVARNGAGNPTTVEHNGQRVSFTYDPWQLERRRASTAVPKTLDGEPIAGSTTLRTDTWIDLRSGAPWSTRDANGALVETRRDGDGRVLSSYDANGALVSTNAWDDSAPRVNVERRFFATGTGVRTDTTVDAAGDVLTQVAWTLGSGGALSEPRRTQAFDLDSAGRVRRSYYPEATANEPSASSVFEESDYDARGRPVLHRVPDGTPAGRETSYAYAPRLVELLDPLGVDTVSSFDWRGDLVDVQRSGGATLHTGVSMVRDGAGRIASIKDGVGDRRFAYDEGGRLRFFTLPSQSGPAPVFEQCHDVNGVLRSTIDPTGALVTLEVDALARPIRKIVDAPGGQEQYTWSYDNAANVALGRVWRAQSPLTTTETGYDRRGFPTQTSTTVAAHVGGLSSWAVKASYGLQGELGRYDASGVPVGQAGSVALGAIALRRDARGQVVGVDEGATEIVGVPSYDAFGRVASLPLGQRPATASNRLLASWQWDLLTQDLRDIAYARSSAPGAPLVHVALSDYAKDGTPLTEQRTGSIDAVGSGVTVLKKHKLDALGRLSSSMVLKNGSSVADEEYRYLENGALASAGGAAYQYADQRFAGAATALGTRTLGYNAAGAVESDSLGARSLSYDAQGCLREIASSDGRRFTQACDAAGVSQYRAWKGASVLQLGMAELRPDEKLLVHRLPLQGTVQAEVVYSLKGVRMSTSRVLMHDARGSVVATAPLFTTGTPSTSESQDFDAWGKLVSTTVGARPRHGFVDGEREEAFGTTSFGVRVYDPSLRRWLSPDPLIAANPAVDLGVGAQLDLWGYAAGNPVRMTDRRGGYADESPAWDRLARSQDSMSGAEKLVMAGVAVGAAIFGVLSAAVMGAGGVSAAAMAAVPAEAVPLVTAAAPVATGVGLALADQGGPAAGRAVDAASDVAKAAAQSSGRAAAVFAEHSATLEGLLAQTVARPGTTHAVPGGLAGAVRHTRETGELVGGSDHVVKAQGVINGLEDLIKRVNKSFSLSAGQREELVAPASQKVDELTQALNAKPKVSE